MEEKHLDQKMTVEESHHELRSWLLILTIVVAMMLLTMIYFMVWTMTCFDRHQLNTTDHQIELLKLDDEMKKTKTELEDLRTDNRELRQATTPSAKIMDDTPAQ